MKTRGIFLMVGAFVVSLGSCAPSFEPISSSENSLLSVSVPMQVEELFPEYAEQLMAGGGGECYCWQDERQEWFCILLPSTSACKPVELMIRYQEEMPCPLDEMAALIASIKQKRKGKLYVRVAYIEGNLDGFRYCDSLNSSNYLTYIYLYGRLGLDVPAFIMDEYYPKSF